MKLAAWICFAPALVFAQAVTITGTVTNAITREPIAGVTIRLFAERDLREISTDSNGVFRAEGMENCCRVLFDKEGFEAVGPSNLQLRVTAGSPPLNLTMLPWPVLRGRVLDPDRRPMVGSTVEAINLRWGRKTVKTGSNGEFAFEHSLSPGEYVLMATPATVQRTDSTELAPSYFPDATERESAGKVVLKAADNLSGYDIVARRVPVFHVRGRVVDERGEPAAEAVLQAPNASAKATADENGRFEWAGVRPGTAVVQADWRRGETSLRGFTEITVRDRGLEDVTIRVAPPVVVSGAAELDGKPARVDGTGFLVPVDGNGSPAEAPFGEAGIQFNGVYPGRYRLEMSISSGFAHSMYLDSVRMGERDVTVDDFDIAAGALPLRVLLKSGGGRVSGTVRDGTGGILVLAPKEERLRRPEFMAVSFFSGGIFQVDNVRPGDYYAFAIRGVFNQSQMRDSAYAARVLAGAPLIRVEENGTATASVVYVDGDSAR